MSVALLMVVSMMTATDPVEATLFAPKAHPQLSAAITAQLVDLHVRLGTLPEPDEWEATEGGQLRQLRRLLLGQPTRLAVWVEVSPLQVHMVDVWTGRQVIRALTLESGGREAAALMVRSAVASFVEQEIEARGFVAPPTTLYFAALWHATKWSTAAPWAHGPTLEFGFSFAPPVGAWAWGRFELPVLVETRGVRLVLQRTEVGLGLDAQWRFGRLGLRPRAGLGVRFLRVTPSSLVDGLQSAAPATDVGLAAVLGLAVSMRLFGPIEAVAQGWGAVALRSAQYQVQEPTQLVTIVAANRIEGGMAVGVAAAF